jgi:hypothetical protein
VIILDLNGKVDTGPVRLGDVIPYKRKTLYGKTY